MLDYISANRRAEHEDCDSFNDLGYALDSAVFDCGGRGRKSPVHHRSELEKGGGVAEETVRAI